MDEQMKIRIKANGVYKIGLVWFRVNERWVKVKTLRMKKDGSWVLTKTPTV